MPIHTVDSRDHIPLPNPHPSRTMEFLLEVLTLDVRHLWKNHRLEQVCDP